MALVVDLRGRLELGGVEMVGKADMWSPCSPAVVKVEKNKNPVSSSSCEGAGVPVVAAAVAFFGAFRGWSCWYLACAAESLKQASILWPVFMQ